MKSIVYWHPDIYSALIKLSYGRNYKARYETVSELIKNNSTVMDICCGDCKIASFLKNRHIDYTGLDFNQTFVKSANQKGIKAKIFDINKQDVPKADYILMQGSLYQFYPNQEQIIRKLLDSASKYLIISEPVRNRAHSKKGIISFLSVLLSDPGDGLKKFKFDTLSLGKAMLPFKSDIKNEFLAANGIDYFFVLSKN